MDDPPLSAVWACVMSSSAWAVFSWYCDKPDEPPAFRAASASANNCRAWAMRTSGEVDVDGFGRVMSQRPEPGRQVPAGTRVHVTLGAG